MGKISLPEKEIENRVNFKLSIYETKDTQQVKTTLPKLKPIKGTFELHEMSATKQGLLVSKSTSSDTDILTRINFFI